MQSYSQIELIFCKRFLATLQKIKEKRRLLLKNNRIWAKILGIGFLPRA